MGSAASRQRVKSYQLPHARRGFPPDPPHALGLRHSQRQAPIRCSAALLAHVRATPREESLVPPVHLHRLVVGTWSRGPLEPGASP